MKLSELESLALDLYKHGYLYSEAFPLWKWKLNEWPNLTAEEHKIVDAFLKLNHLRANYKES